MRESVCSPLSMKYRSTEVAAIIIIIIFIIIIRFLPVVLMATNEVAEKYMFVVFATEEENSCSLLVTNGSVGLTPYFLLPVAVFVTSRVVCSSHPRASLE